MTGAIAYQEIEQKRPLLEDIALKMWNHPEGPYREYQAAQWTADALEAEGFTVERGAAGVPTAVKASWGIGHPVIGFLGELDALPGLSQTVSTSKQPIEGQAYGHGCGHNLLAAGALGAALGLKKELNDRKMSGTVVFYGCPAEEVMTGKGYMARGGAFDGLDVCVECHPFPENGVRIGQASLAMNSVKFHFKGRTAHAGGDPHNGRSALDALELMNVGAQYLREHVTSDVRIHYITLEGGTAPNIVPDKASSWYMVRAYTRDAVEDTYQRLLKIAKGAAMMTETEVEVEFLGGCYERMPNMVLSKLAYQCQLEVPASDWSPEDIAFAKALNETAPKVYEANIQAFEAPQGTQLHSGVQSFQERLKAGSSDVGDVQHICPGISISTAASAIGCPGHSWQVTACSGHSIGLKGMIRACKVMALFGLKVAENPELLRQAQEEFKTSMGGKTYVCPIPAEVPVP